MCNINPERTGIILQENNLCNIFLNLPGSTMYKAIACAMLTYSPQSSQCCLNTSKTMLYETKYLCNVDPWLTDNVYEKNNLYNTVLTILGHFIHCLVNVVNVWDNTPKKIVLYIQSILAQKAQTCFCRKASCTVVSNLW